jgi:phosphoribosylpyrophosphate synthetase
MAPEALARLAAAGVQRVATTDSVPLALRPGLEVVSVAPVLAREIVRLSR